MIRPDWRAQGNNVQVKLMILQKNMEISKKSSSACHFVLAGPEVGT